MAQRRRTSADRGGDAVRAGDAVGALLQGRLGKGLSAASAAAKAWYAANGDRERKHTTGVWLRKSGRTGCDPVLVVALDSNLLAMELGTNKDLYLARLAYHGLAVSDIRFTVRRDPATDRRRSGALKQSPRPTPLPELTAAEVKRVERACEDLPDGLRQSACRAMCASLRRNKARSTYKS